MCLQRVVTRLTPLRPPSDKLPIIDQRPATTIREAEAEAVRCFALHTLTAKQNTLAKVTCDRTRARELRWAATHDVFVCSCVLAFIVRAHATHRTAGC